MTLERTACWGLMVGPYPTDDGGVLWAEVEPASTGWRPLPGRMSRWWYEIHYTDAKGEGSTYAYLPGGSNGGFSLRACVRRATAAAYHFAHEYDRG